MNYVANLLIHVGDSYCWVPALKKKQQTIDLARETSSWKLRGHGKAEPTGLKWLDASHVLRDLMQRLLSISIYSTT